MTERSVNTQFYDRFCFNLNVILKITFQVGPHEQELRLKIEIYDNDYNSADQLLGVTHLRFKALAYQIHVTVIIASTWSLAA